MKCEACGNQSDDVTEYSFPVDNHHLIACPGCAADNGFCMICGYFCAGTEDYDFSPIKGVCGECVDDLRYETGEYDEPDEYFDM